MGGVSLLGSVGAFGLLGPSGHWIGVAGSLAASWTLWRHRWPLRAPRRLRPGESPHGPDERAAVVEFRDEGVLLGWDVGIVWFERGGVGFVGRTVSFVLPRALMQIVELPVTFQTAVRVPQLTARVFGTTLGILPLDRELNAASTIARIDALPHEVTSETVLPPSSLHPDLLARGLAVRRRIPCLYALLLSGPGVLWFSALLGGSATGPGFALVRACLNLLTLALLVVVSIVPLPSAVRDRLPGEPRRRRPF